MKINDRCIIITMHLSASLAFSPSSSCPPPLSLSLCIAVCLPVWLRARVYECMCACAQLVAYATLTRYLPLPECIRIWRLVCLSVILSQYPEVSRAISGHREGRINGRPRDQMCQRCGRPNSGVHFPNSSRMLVHLFNSMSRVTMALL